MKKIKITHVQLTVSLAAAALLLLIAALVFFNPFQRANDPLNGKMNAYAKEHGISIEAIKKDKGLLTQLEMEVAQEEKMQQLTEDIQVTAEDVENYRNMIGTSMNKEKAIFILFDSEAKCKDFISTYGNEPNPQIHGIGTIPLMQDDGSGAYYNVVGNEILERIFENLNDGEYTKEPFAYAGMYCYLKRIGIDSPMDSDENLIELIKSEKAHALMQNENKE